MSSRGIVMGHACLRFAEKGLCNEANAVYSLLESNSYTLDDSQLERLAVCFHQSVYPELQTKAIEFVNFHLIVPLS